ncbi:recombinase family protein [Candidatus Sumerlaeota bacterium]|nr:recombinase family protein [Candidatus Sumerlaeota bacterium]
MKKPNQQPPPDNHAKRVGIWIRVSTEDQARGDSPQHHETRARQYAELKNWQIVTVYHLEAVSGKSVVEHPEARRMLADIKEGRISGLIFSKLARLARNTKELLEIAEVFERYDADLISLHESIDTSSPAGRLFYTMFAAMAQWEREEIADRVAATVPVRAQLGKSTGGQAPFGYQWKDNQLIPDPAEAPIRRKIFELYKEHRRKKTVAQLLNEAGYRTRQGAKFTDSTVHRLLTDPIAKGQRRVNYTKNSGDGHWKLKPESEWVYVNVEPVVDEELWNVCNQILNDQRVKRRPVGKKPAHLFAGMAVCHCGQKMYVPSNSPKYICKKCRNKIPADDLEAIYFEQLKAFFLSPEETADYLESADQVLKEKEELIRALEQERETAAKEMDRVYQLYIDGTISSQGFGQRYRPLEEQVNQLDDQIAKLQGEADCLRISYQSSDQILTEARDLYSHWQDLDFDDKRHIIENITESIVIGDGDITIDLCYLPSYQDMAKGQRIVSEAADPCPLACRRWPR